MANQYLTYRFYTFLTNPGAPSNVPRRYKTYKPMTYDSVYFLPSEMTYDDAFDILIVEGKTEEESTNLLNNPNGYFNPNQNHNAVHSYLNASSQLYNGIIVRDGVESKIKPRGVTFQFDYDSIIAIIDTSDDQYGQILDESVIEIALQYARPQIPWIYYSTNRYDLATRLSREPTGMGGVQPSVVPADAIQMSYRIDGDVTPIAPTGTVIPFASSAIIPSFGSSSASKDIWTLWDILDGRLNPDGTARVAIRSSTLFNASSLSQTGGFGGVTNLVTLFQTGWATESYRNIHSKTLEYQTTTYGPNKVIKNNTFILICEAKYNLKNFYSNLAASFNRNLYDYIDFETCRFDVWQLTKGEGMNIPTPVGTTSYQNSSAEDNDQSSLVASFMNQISNSISATAPVKIAYTPSFKDSFKKLHNTDVPYEDPPHTGIIQKLFTEDVVRYRRGIQDVNPEETRYSVIFMSDMNFEYQEIDVGTIDEPKVDYSSFDLEESRQSVDMFPLEVESSELLSDPSEPIIREVKEKYSTTNLTLSGVVCIGRGKESIYIIDPDTKNSVNYQDYIEKHCKYIFSEPYSFTMIGTEGFNAFVVEFLNSLARDYSIDIENDMLSEDPTVNSNFISKQCLELTTPLPYISEDKTGDGKTSLVDHIYDLYGKKFPPQDNSAEIRYWRKMCPIGNLYRVRGTISGSVSMNFGDYYFKFNIDNNPNNSIWIYVERGARTNISKAPITDEFEMQGRLFHPAYFRTISLDSFMDFTTLDGIVEWYRLTRSSLWFLYYNIWAIDPGKPVLVIRSNDLLTQGGGYFPPILFDGITDGTYKDGATSVFVSDKIGDYIFDKSAEKDPFEDIPEGFVQLGRGESIVCFDTGEVDIVIEDLTFKMEILDNNGKYKYEILYDNAAGEGPFKLWEFYSDVAKLSEDNIVNLPLSGFYKLPCDIGEGEDNKTLYVKYPYSQKKISGSENNATISYDFKWSPNIFSVVSVWRNDDKIGSKLNVPGVYSITPSEGKIVFEDGVNLDLELIQIELVNVSDLSKEERQEKDYNVTKRGSRLEIKRIEDGIENSEEGSPKISMIEANAGRDDSVERVECVFFHNSRGTKKHYIAPAHGFFYISGDGSWSMSVDSGARDLAGDLNSPYFYIDKSLEFDDRNRIVDKSDSTLVSIDRIYGNVASRARMMVYTRTTLESPSVEVKKVQRTTVHHSPTTKKTTLVYIDEGILNQKFSYVSFDGKEDVFTEGEKKWERKYSYEGGDESFYVANFKNSNPVRPWKISYPESPLFSSSGEEESIFDVQSNLGELAVLGILSEKPIPNTFLRSDPYEIYASLSSSGGDESFYPFGYESFSGIKTSKRFSSYGGDQQVFAHSFIYLPDTRNVSRIKIKKPVDINGESISNAGNIKFVLGGYTQDYTEGSSPHLDEAANGKMMLYYLDKENKKILLYSTHNRGYDWNRPKVDDETSKDGEPIPIYENKIGIGNLIGVNDGVNRFNNIFFYNYENSSIDMIMVPTSRAMEIYQGFGESVEEVIAEDEEKGFDPLTLTSWEAYFNGGMNIRRVLNTSNDNFGVTVDNKGVIWAIVSTPQGAVKVMYNYRLRGAEEGEGTDWVISGIDLIDDGTIAGEGDGTMLYKALNGKKITSLSLNFDKVEELMYVFLTTDDRQLILFPVSTSVLSYNANILKQENVQRNQKRINKIKPILVVGDVSKFSESKDFIFLENPFLENKRKIDAQSISATFSNKGLCTLFYYDENLQIKAIESSNLKYWRENINV